MAKNKIEEHGIKISANSVAEFQSIQEKVEKLPPAILMQIETVTESLGGTHCIFRDKFETKPILYIPADTKKIVQKKAEIWIYSKDFFFEFKSKSFDEIEYEFIKC